MAATALRTWPSEIGRTAWTITARSSGPVTSLDEVIAWGDHWLAGKPGPPVLYRHHACVEIGSVELRRTKGISGHRWR